MTDVVKSEDGWVLFVRGIHEEASEDRIYDAFAEFGRVKALHLNLDRKTGYNKGYAMVQFEEFEEAQEALNELNGKRILGKEICVDFAFKKPKSD